MKNISTNRIIHKISRMQPTMMAFMAFFLACGFISTTGCVLSPTATTSSSTSFSTSTVTTTPPPVGALYVSDYGAVGDGITDDSAAMNAAVAALGSGDSLAFEAGKEYLLCTNLNFSNKTNFKIYGQGATIKICDNYDFDTYTDTIFFYHADTFSVYDLIIDGNRDNNVLIESWRYNLVKIMESQNGSFFNVESSNASCDGFYFDTWFRDDTNLYNKNFNMINCVADNCYRDGISIIIGWNFNIIGGHYNGANGQWPQSGIDVEPELDVELPGADNILIKNVAFISNFGNGIQSSGKGGVIHVTIEDCYFNDNHHSSIRMQSQDSIIRGNVIYNHVTTVPEDSVGEKPWLLTRYTLLIGNSGPPYAMGYNVVVEDNIIAKCDTGKPVIVMNDIVNNPTIRNNELYDFSNESIYLDVPGQETDFYDSTNTINKSKVIADPGFPWEN